MKWTLIAVVVLGIATGLMLEAYHGGSGSSHPEDENL